MERQHTYTMKYSDTIRQLISVSDDFQRELLRKAIHMLIALVPALASIDKGATLALLGCGTLVYTYVELLRLSGRKVVFISTITSLAQRDRDIGKFVMGPVTLGLGAMTALLLYPEPAISVAIYALAFGDSIASVIGKLFGRTKIPFSGGKTIAGSTACFLMVFFISFRITGRLAESVEIAAVAAILEMLPFKDLDNIVLPAGAGFIASQIFI